MKTDVNELILENASIKAKLEECQRRNIKLSEELKEKKEMYHNYRSLLSRVLALCSFLKYNKNENIRERAISINSTYLKIIEETNGRPIRFNEFNPNHDKQ